MFSKSLALAAVAAFTLAGAANAATLHFMATLNGGAETPPNSSAGTGMAMATLDTDTKVFSYTLSYANLSGPAIAAHFHLGAPGVSGPPVVPITGNLASPITGAATLTEAQIADLEAGKWYVNVHTAEHKPGEIRGQVLMGK